MDMTTEQFFDLVSPVAIYHCADVCFKKKAQAAWKKIVRLDPSEYGKLGITAAPAVGVDEAHSWAKEAYDAMFQRIVDDRTDWEFFYDLGGAKAYRDKGVPVFAGDGGNQFPWYETAQLLHRRIDMAGS